MLYILSNMTTNSDPVSKVLDVVAEAGEQVISTITDLQDQALSAIEAIAVQVNSVFADFPGASLLPKVTPVDPAKGVEIFFGFAEKMLEVEKGYALRLCALLPAPTEPAAPVKPTVTASAKSAK